MQTKYSWCWSPQDKQKEEAGTGRAGVMSDQAGQGRAAICSMVRDPADQKTCCSFFWIVLQSRKENSNIKSTSCVWSLSVNSVWDERENERLLQFDGVWVSQASGPSRPATVESRQRFDWQLFTLGYFLWSKWILTSKKCITSSSVPRRPQRALSPILYQELQNQRWIIVLLWLWLEEQKFC